MEFKENDCIDKEIPNDLLKGHERGSVAFSGESNPDLIRQALVIDQQCGWRAEAEEKRSGSHVRKQLNNTSSFEIEL